LTPATRGLHRRGRREFGTSHQHLDFRRWDPRRRDGTGLHDAPISGSMPRDRTRVHPLQEAFLEPLGRERVVVVGSD
jgi:hypothetical protein